MKLLSVFSRRGNRISTRSRSQRKLKARRLQVESLSKREMMAADLDSGDLENNHSINAAATDLVAHDRLYATTGSGSSSFQLLSLESTGSEATPVGYVGFISRLDVRPTDGQLYGVSLSSVYRIDADSGQRDYLGSIRNQEGSVISTSAATFDPNGHLFVTDYVSNLYRIEDLESLEATLLGNIGRYTSAMEFASDGTLYGAQRGLYTINATTAQVEREIGTSGSYLYELDVSGDGTLRALDQTGDKLIEIDRQTGQRTVVGEFDASLASLASVGENPSSSPYATPPVIVDQTLSSDEGETAEFTLRATDADANDNVAWEVVDKPEFVEFSDDGSGQAVVSITPGHQDAGEHNVEVLATDMAGNQVTHTFTLIVNDVPVDNDADAPTRSVEIQFLATSRGGPNAYHLLSLDELDSEPASLGRVGYVSRLDMRPTDGQLYGVSGSSIYRIDPDSGEKEYLGTFRTPTGSFVSTSAATFDEEGHLYVADYSYDLYRVDVEMLEATLVGHIGRYTTGLEFAADGTLYGAQRGLFTIDAATAKPVQEIGSSTGSYLYELDLDANGILRAVDETRRTVVEVDRLTGQRSVVGQFDDSLASLASVAVVTPEPPQENRNPVAGEVSLVGVEDQILRIDAEGGLAANASDPDNDSLEFSLLSSPQYGQVTVNQDGSFQYTPEDEYSGSDSFTYSIIDGNGGTASGVAALTIQSVNDGPTAADDTATVDEDVTQWPMGFLANDFDADGDLMSIVEASATRGTVTIADDGQGVLYTPLADFHGTDTILYTVDDSNGGTDRGTATVRVRPANDAPVAVDDAFSVVEDSQANVVDVLANDSDIDGDSLTIRGPSALHGTVEFVEGRLRYTPDPEFSGLDAIRYLVDDGHGGSDVATAAVTVMPVNDAPVASDDTLSILEEDRGVVTVLANDTDVDAEEGSLRVVITRNPSSGTATVDQHGAITYVPDEDFFGNDSINYSVSDGRGGSDTATVEISVTGINDAPTATLASSEIIVNSETSASLQLNRLFNDVDRETLNYELFDERNGQLLTTAIDVENQVLEFTPQTGRQGVARYTLVASDAEGESAKTELTVLSKPAENGIRFEQSTDDGRFWLTEEGQLFDHSESIAVAVKQAIMLGDDLFTLRFDGTVHLHTGDPHQPWQHLEAEDDQIFHSLATYENQLIALGWEASGHSTGNVFRLSKTGGFTFGSTTVPEVHTWSLMDLDAGHNATDLVNHDGKTFVRRSNGRVYMAVDLDNDFDRLGGNLDRLYDAYRERTSQFDPRPSVVSEISSLRTLRQRATGPTTRSYLDEAIVILQSLNSTGHQLGPDEAAFEVSAAINRVMFADWLSESWPGWRAPGDLSFRTYSDLILSHDMLFALRDSHNELVSYDKNRMFNDAFLWEPANVPGSGPVTSLVKHGNDAFILRGDDVYRFGRDGWRQVLGGGSESFTHLVAANSGLFVLRDDGKVFQFNGDAVGGWTDVSGDLTFDSLFIDEVTQRLASTSGNTIRYYVGGGWDDSVSLVWKNGRELRIIGRDDKNDMVRLFQEGDKLNVTLNDPDAAFSTRSDDNRRFSLTEIFDRIPEDLVSTFTLDIDTIDHIHFEGLGGNDIFYGDVDVAITADGGAGADILYGGTAENHLIGDDQDTLYDPAQVARVQEQLAQQRVKLADANQQLEQAQRKRVRVIELEAQRATEIERQKRNAVDRLAAQQGVTAVRQAEARARAEREIAIEQARNDVRKRNAIRSATQEISSAESKKNNEIRGIKVPKWLANASKWLADRAKPIEKAFDDAKAAILQARDRAINSLEAEFNNFVSSVQDVRDRAVNGLQSEFDNFKASIEDATRPGGLIEQTVKEQFAHPIRQLEQAADTLENVAKPIVVQVEQAIESLSETAADFDEFRTDTIADIGEGVDDLIRDSVEGVSDTISEVDDFIQKNPGLIGPLGPIYTYVSIRAEGRNPTPGELAGIIANGLSGGTAGQFFTISKLALPGKGKELVEQFEVAVNRMIEAPFRASEALKDQLKALGELDFNSIALPADVPDFIGQSEALQFLDSNPLDPDKLLERVSNTFDADLLTDIASSLLDFVELRFNDRTGWWAAKLRVPQRPDLKFEFEFRTKSSTNWDLADWKVTGGYDFGPIDIELSGSKDTSPLLVLDVDAGPLTLDASINLEEASRNSLDSIDLELRFEKSKDIIVSLMGELQLDGSGGEFQAEISLGRDVLPESWGDRTPLRILYTPPGPSDEKIQLLWKPLEVSANAGFVSGSVTVNGLVAHREGNNWYLELDAHPEISVDFARLHSAFDSMFRDALAESLAGYQGALDDAGVSNLLESVYDHTIGALGISGLGISGLGSSGLGSSGLGSSGLGSPGLGLQSTGPQAGFGLTASSPSGESTDPQSTAARLRFDLLKPGYHSDLKAIRLRDSERHFSQGAEYAAGWLEWAKSNREVMTEEEALLFARLAYTAKKDEMHGDWVVEDVEEDETSGFRAVLLVSTRESNANGKPRAVAAFAGTDPTTLTDLVTDGVQTLGGTPTQYTLADLVAAKWKAVHGQSLLTAGHSLGGGLAAYAAGIHGLAGTGINSAPLGSTAAAKVRANAGPSSFVHYVNSNDTIWQSPGVQFGTVCMHENGLVGVNPVAGHFMGTVDPDKPLHCRQRS